MSALQWVAVIGIAAILLLAGFYAWAVRYALSTVSEWEDEGE